MSTKASASASTSKGMVPMLEGENYNMWKDMMTNFLQSKGLYKFVTARAQELLDDEDLSSKEKNELLDQDEQALGHIKCHIIYSLQDIVTDATTALEAWEALRTHFAGKEPFNRNHLLFQLVGPDGYLQESRDMVTAVQEFVAEKNDLVRRLKTAGMVITEDVLVGIMLFQLPPSFDTMRQINEAKPDLTAAQLCADLHREALRQKNQRKRKKEDDSAMFAGDNSQTRPPPPKKLKFAKKDKKGDKKEVICDFCDSKGHEVGDCWFNADSKKFRPDLLEKYCNMSEKIQKKLRTGTKQ